jgi:hypothetical protein
VFASRAETDEAQRAHFIHRIEAQAVS